MLSGAGGGGVGLVKCLPGDPPTCSQVGAQSAASLLLDRPNRMEAVGGAGGVDRK